MRGHVRLGDRRVGRGGTRADGGPVASRGPGVGNKSAGHLRPAVTLYASIWLFAWWISKRVLSWYTGGDLVQYRAYWELAGRSDFSNARLQQLSYLGGAEPGYAYVAHIASVYISHDVFMSAVNATFVVVLFAWLRKCDAPGLFVILVFSNFYLLVLLVPAERLKFAALALALGFMCRSWLRAMAWALAPLFHLQAVLVLMMVAIDVVGGLGGRLTVARRVALLMGLATVGFVVYRVSGQAGIEKAQGYSQAAGGLGWIPAAMVALLILLFLPRRRGLLFSAVMLAGAAVVLGGDRINMMSIFLLVAAFVQERKFGHPAVLLTLLYFSWRGVEFLIRVHQTGSGF